MNAAKYILLLSLTACAHAPQAVSGAAAQPAVQQEEVSVEKLSANLPKQALTGELLYEYLVSEIGNQRGYKMLAVNGSSDLARKTRDPRVAKRAAQLAFESGDMDKSISSLLPAHFRKGFMSYFITAPFFSNGARSSSKSFSGTY